MVCSNAGRQTGQRMTWGTSAVSGHDRDGEHLGERPAGSRTFWRRFGTCQGTGLLLVAHAGRDCPRGSMRTGTAPGVHKDRESPGGSSGQGHPGVHGDRDSLEGT